MSQMEWAPFKSLFWNTNELIDLFESIDKFDLFYKQRFIWRQTLILKYAIYNSDNKCRKRTTI